MHATSKRIIAAVVLALGGLMAPWAPTHVASAHATLEASLPAANSVLDEAPKQIILDFDEPVVVALSSVEVFDSDRRPVAVDQPASPGDESIVVADIAIDLGAGAYAVRWRVSSADGHVVDGAFSFQVGTSASAEASASLLGALAQGAGSDRLVAGLLVAARGVSMLAVILACGVALLGLGDRSPRRSRPLAWWSIALVVASTVASFVLHTARTAGGSLADGFDTSRWADVLDTTTGRAYMVRVMLALAATGLMLQWPSRPAGWWRVGSAAALAGTLLTFPFAGHAAALALPYALNDAVHLAAVGLWVGGLIVLATAGRAWFADDTNHTLVHRFSRTATVAVPVIVATGVAQTWRLAGGWDGITDSGWGRTLLVKVTLVVVLVTLGGVGRWLLHNSGAPDVRRSVLLEAVIGVVVVGLAAGLVAQPPRPAAADAVFSSTLAAGGVIADITVTPGRVGSNEIHLVLTPPGGNLQPVESVQVRMSNDAAGIPNTPATVTNESTNHYTLTVTLPEAGTWQLEVIVETAPAQSVLLTADVPIAD
jgi:copper transport protein